MACKGFLSDFPTVFVREGNVQVQVPRLDAYVKSPSDYAPSKAPVFYNPVMELNRDLAVLVLQVYQSLIGRSISVCEPLAACGIRGVRFGMEIRGVEKVVMGDINENAFRLSCCNVEMNGLSDLVSVRNDEANYLLSCYSAPHTRFDVIDVDPFGSPVPFLESSVRALRDGGLLALTATDMAPLCGVHQKACVRKYGGKPLRTEYCHELAVRLLVGCLVRTAARFNMGIDPVFSHSAEHYVRVYSIIKHGAKNADDSLEKMGYVLHCFNCFHRETVAGLFGIDAGKKCAQCGSKLSLAGPMWLGQLSDPRFCKSLEKEAEKRTLRLGTKIRRLLSLVAAESEGPISYFIVDKLCHNLGLPVPAVSRLVEALIAEGFQACRTHFSSRGLRTDAPALKVREIVRDLTKEKS